MLLILQKNTVRMSGENVGQDFNVQISTILFIQKRDFSSACIKKTTQKTQSTSPESGSPQATIQDTCLGFHPPWDLGFLGCQGQ